jgi:HEAT repeat protein
MVHDVDLEVACAAVERIALYPGLETTQRIAELVAHPSPRIRQSAVRAAGRLGQHGMALHATQDPAAGVRAAAAEALASLDTRESAAALKSLLENDRSTEVQSAAVDAAGRLSDDLAVDVLLAGLDSAAVRTRERSARALARYLPQAKEFPIHESAADRADRIDSLRRDWAARAPSAQPRRDASPASPPPASPRIAELVRAWHVAGGPMRRRAEDELRSLPPAALPEIEAEFLAADAVPGEAFQRQVLAALDPAYAALPLLDATERSVVDSAASQLAGEFARRKPTVLQALLIARAALKCDSRSVWTKAAAIVLRDYGADQDPDAKEFPLLAAAVDRLVEAGLAHPDEWVRLAICERLEAAPSPRSADRLAALMKDPSERVRRAAIRAAGAASDPGLAESLRAALRSPSVAVQLEAAAQLCRLGDRDGLEALRRLSFSPDHEVRRRVVQEAAASADLVDRESVLRLLTNALADAKLEVREQAIGALERVVGYASSPSGRFAPHDEQVARWKKAMASLLNPDDGRDKSWESLREIQRAHERMRTAPLAH